VRVVSPEDNERLRQQEASHSNLQSILPDLVNYVRQGWDSAKRAKIRIEEQMVDAIRMRNSEYSPDKLKKIQQTGGSEAYFNLPETKCRAAKAWIEDILLQPGESPWGIKPSPSPELSPIELSKLAQRIQEAAINQAVMAEQQTGQPVNIQALRSTIEQALVIAEAHISDAERKQAAATAEKMETTIEDQLHAARFKPELRMFVDDIVTFHCAILKGPTGRMSSELEWEQTEQGAFPKIGKKLILQAKRVSPFNIYPGADATGPNDGDIYERCRYTRRDLEGMIGVPGYREDAIRSVLYEHRSGGLREWLWTDNEIDRIRNISQLSSYDTSKIDALECYLSVPGSMLLQWNIPGVTDVTQEYEIIGILIGRHLVYVTLNPHPLNQRPYSVASMMSNPDGFWGRGIPQTIKHDVEGANAIYRSIFNNAAMASGPLVQEFVDRLAPGEIPGQIYPMKVYLTTDDMTGSNQAPVQFFNVPLTALGMIDVLRYVAAMADEHSGVPAYAHGSEDVGGAGDTASGLSMLMTAAARGIKNVVRNIDEAIEDFIKRYYVWNMLYNPDQTIKGDLEVIVRASTELLIKEQLLIRRKEILAQTNNPVDLQITGLEGRANLLREVLKAADIPVDEVIMGQPNAPIVDPANNSNPQAQSQNTDAAGNPAGGQDGAMVAQPPVKQVAQ
jgi:hypothetical protein